jgi:hypothetical protein
MELNEVSGEPFTDAMESALVISSNYVHLNDCHMRKRLGRRLAQGLAQIVRFDSPSLTSQPYLARSLCADYAAREQAMTIDG